jgi:tetratricopeptide (TPR) repeat protein
VAVDRDKVLQAAQKLVEKKRYDKAIVEYQKLVADDPKDVRTLLKIGDLHLKLEQHVEAITTYERVGQFYSLQGFALKAIAVYKQIREIIHKHVPHMEDRFGHIVPRLAEIYTQLGLTSDALAAYDEVATRLQRAGRDRDAIDIFKKVVDLDPQNPLPYLRLAEAFIRVKDLDSAVARFSSAADILISMGRKDDSLKVVERLLQHRPDPRFARVAAEIYLERGQPSDAMAALTKLQISFKDNPKDLDTLALLARAFDKLSQPAKAIEVQKEAARIAKETNKLDVFNALVLALLTRAPNDEAVHALAAQRAALLIDAAPAVDPRASIDIEMDEEVALDEDDLAAPSEAPFALRPSYGSIQVPPQLPTRPRVVVPPPPADPSVRARQLISESERYRAQKDYDAALAVLLGAIQEIPSFRELREKLCDLLIEAGDQAEAVRQMLGFARWLEQDGDVEGAARLLDEVLLLEPGQPEALAMLQELGYAVGPEAYVEGAGGFSPSATGTHPFALQGGGDPYDPSAPLPSYDLEEISAVEALAHRPGPSSSYRPQAFAAEDLDDPFGADAPLPSFAIDDESVPFAQASPRDYPRDSYLPEQAGSPEIFDSAQRVSMPAAPFSRGSDPSVQLDEEALEEVEFFATNGMFDEARNLLDEQLQRLPNHPLLLERKREIESLLGGGNGDLDNAGGSGVVARSGAPGEDRSFDIAASLDALDALDAGPQPRAAPQEQISVESVFEQFKAGVAAQISESDAATHYDLGVAYKEMGLFNDAVSEFELASRDPARDCVCQSMIGMIHLQLGNVDAAIDAFIRGLHASVKTREQELALTYEIGDSYEQRRAPDQAIYYFQRVARLEPGYKDMRGAPAERARRLSPGVAKAQSQVASRSDLVLDDFDAALDDLLGGSKLP